jgi:hypothetical protein
VAVEFARRYYAPLMLAMLNAEGPCFPIYLSVPSGTLLQPHLPVLRPSLPTSERRPGAPAHPSRAGGVMRSASIKRPLERLIPPAVGALNRVPCFEAEGRDLFEAACRLEDQDTWSPSSTR